MKLIPSQSVAMWVGNNVLWTWLQVQIMTNRIERTNERHIRKLQTDENERNRTQNWSRKHFLYSRQNVYLKSYYLTILKSIHPLESHLFYTCFKRYIASILSPYTCKQRIHTHERIESYFSDVNQQHFQNFVSVRVWNSINFRIKYSDRECGRPTRNTLCTIHMKWTCKTTWIIWDEPNSESGLRMTHTRTSSVGTFAFVFARNLVVVKFSHAMNQPASASVRSTPQLCALHMQTQQWIRTWNTIHSLRISRLDSV